MTNCDLVAVWQENIFGARNAGARAVIIANTTGEAWSISFVFLARHPGL
jgi:hypothetical protein